MVFFHSNYKHTLRLISKSTYKKSKIKSLLLLKVQLLQNVLLPKNSFIESNVVASRRFVPWSLKSKKTSVDRKETERTHALKAPNRQLRQVLSLTSLCAFLMTLSAFSFSQEGQKGHVYGRVSGENSEQLEGVEIDFIEAKRSIYTNHEGNFLLMDIPYGKYKVLIFKEGFEAIRFDFTVDSEQHLIERVLGRSQGYLDTYEVFGKRKSEVEKLDAITRLPLKPYEQIQSISVVSEKLIEQQGNLTVADATRNVVGVYTYATYGGVRESMSSRGFRGIPILKNGVRVHSDFRGTGVSTDFSGVESIQVIKGANAVNMGATNDLGAPGGLINIVTKTPKYINGGTVSIRGGSFNQFRPTFDVQNVLNREGNLAFRINGAYENVRTFHNIEGIGQDKFYINPSLAWKPNSRSELIFEMDYLDDSRAFDPGTVNRSIGNRENEIYDLPMDRFLGFKGNVSTQKSTSYTLRYRRDISEKVYLRAALYHSNYISDGVISSLSALGKVDSLNINTIENSVYRRSVGRNNTRWDKNTVVQFDVIGHKIKTGIFKHTFQAGLDFRTNELREQSFNSLVVDTIDIYREVNNKLPGSVGNFAMTGEEISYTRSIGVSAQEVLEIGQRVRLFGGFRFGTSQSRSETSNVVEQENFINPVAGAMLRVWKDVNLFASYTNSTNPRTAALLDINGEALGNETVNQFEFGLKSSWMNDRLRFSATYYNIVNNGMNMRAAELNPVTGLVELQTYYFKGGNDTRNGVEIELTGRILPNLELILGYNYIDARYKEHTTFVPGSEPNNTPHTTINAYVNYVFITKALRGLSVGAGYYYLGDRYYNDWTQSNVQFHGITPNLEPWKNKAYALINAQVAYDMRYLQNETLQKFNVRLLINNLTNEVGYDAYRTSFINRINPRNFAAVVSYRF